MNEQEKQKVKEQLLDIEKDIAIYSQHGNAEAQMQATIARIMVINLKLKLL